VVSASELKTEIVGKTFLLNDGRIIRFAANGDYASINGRGSAGRGRWMVDRNDICVNYIGSNTARRCFTFSRFPDGLRVTDRDGTDQHVIPTLLDIASIGRPVTLHACEHDISYALTPPAADVPASARAFAGVWTGEWESGLCGALFVQQILPDGTARLVVGWGSHVRRKPGDMGLLGKIEGTTLTAYGKEFTYTFTMTSPTSIKAVFRVDGSTTGTLNKVR
jgi:hypothetical protein